MISAIRYGVQGEAFALKGTQVPARATLIVMEILLAVSAGVAYLSGVNVLPATILLSTALLIEVSSTIYDYWIRREKTEVEEKTSVEEATPEIAQESNAKVAIAKADPEAAKAYLRTSLGAIADKLQDKKVLTFSASDQTGVKIVHEKYTPPGEKAKTEYSNLKLLEGRTSDCSLIADKILLSKGPQNPDQDMDDFFNIIKAYRKTMVVMATDGVIAKENIGAVDEDLSSSIADALDYNRGVTPCTRYWPSQTQTKQNPLKFGEVQIDYRGNGIKESGVFFRIFAINRPGEQEKLLVQLHFGRGQDQVSEKPEKLYIYAADCWRKLESGQYLLIHDDFGKGKAALFVSCILLLGMHEAAKKRAVAAEVNLDALIDFLRYDPEHGREGFLDREEYYTQLIAYAEHLKKKVF